MSSSLLFCVSQVKKNDYYRYLCCLLCNDNIRDRLFAIYAFNNEIAKIKDIISEPMAGHIRLQWWRDAIDEIYNGAPVKHRHEIVDALYRVVSEVDISKELFDNLIDAREADIEFSTPDNMDVLKNYAIGTSSNLFYLLMAAAGVSDSHAKEAAYYGGISYAIIGIMRSMKYNAYHRRVMFPQDLLDKQEITIDDIAEGRNLEKTKAITRVLCDKAEVNLHHVRGLLGDVSKDALHVLLPVSMVEMFLGRIKKNNYDLFNSDLESGRLGLQWQIYKSRLLGRV